MSHLVVPILFRTLCYLSQRSQEAGFSRRTGEAPCGGTPTAPFQRFRPGQASGQTKLGQHEGNCSLINYWSNTNLSLERYRHEGHQGPLSLSTDSILDRNLCKQNKDIIKDTRDCCVFWLFWTGICTNKISAAWRSSRITASFHQLCSGQESVQIKVGQHESHQGPLHPFINSVLDN